MKYLILLLISVSCFAAPIKGHFVPDDNQASKKSWTTMKSCLKENSSCVDIKIKVDVDNAKAKSDLKASEKLVKTKRDARLLILKNKLEGFDALNDKQKLYLIKPLLKSLLIQMRKVEE